LEIKDWVKKNCCARGHQSAHDALINVLSKEHLIDPTQPVDATFARVVFETAEKLSPIYTPNGLFQVNFT
jgi:hypothetical protein